MAAGHADARAGDRVVVMHALGVGHHGAAVGAPTGTAASHATGGHASGDHEPGGPASVDLASTAPVAPTAHMSSAEHGPAAVVADVAVTVRVAVAGAQAMARWSCASLCCRSCCSCAARPSAPGSGAPRRAINDGSQVCRRRGSAFLPAVRAIPGGALHPARDGARTAVTHDVGRPTAQPLGILRALQVVRLEPGQEPPCRARSVMPPTPDQRRRRPHARRVRGLGPLRHRPPRTCRA